MLRRCTLVVKVVRYTGGARKGLLALPSNVRDAIKAKIARYAETGAGDVSHLKGTNAARLRSGDYRVIFVETVEALEIRAVGHRRDIYR